jgi:tyrosyl-DNA phosphodiesterase-1
MKVHKAIKHLQESHPGGKSIPLDASAQLEDLSRFDFSKVRVKLVMSVPGKYTGFDAMNEYGLCRLGSAIKEARWVPPTGEKLLGEYQVSTNDRSGITADDRDLRLGTIAWDGSRHFTVS